MSTFPRCAFYVRAAHPDGYQYELIEVFSPAGRGRLELEHPPAVGDLIHVGSSGTFRVLERAWHAPNYGSIDWRSGNRNPDIGPMLDLIVEPAQGPFVEAARP